MSQEADTILFRRKLRLQQDLKLPRDHTQLLMQLLYQRKSLPFLSNPSDALNVKYITNSLSIGR